MSIIQYCEHGVVICRDCLIAQNAQIAALEAEVARLQAPKPIMSSGIVDWKETARMQGQRANQAEANLAPFIALAKAAQEIWALIEQGQLVRNTTNDAHFPSYMAESVRLVTGLKALQDALAHPAVQRAIGERR